MILAGCTTAPTWSTRLDDAIVIAKREQRPLYVLSVFGDLSKKC
jgi:hypothetical protein